MNESHTHKQTKDLSSAQFWDEKYSTKDKIWSGKVNETLSRYVQDLAPGRALDLGCGEGGDAIWLAEQGWNVLAADISQIALDRTSAIAKQKGFERKIMCERHDFEHSFPEGKYDLVSAQFLQSPIEMDRAKVLKLAANAVGKKGILLIAEHGAAPPWSDHADMKFPTAQETLESIELDELKLEQLVVGTFEREATSPDGEHGVLLDNVIMLKSLV